MGIAFHLNGRQVRVEADPGTPLLYVLRNELALNGPKFGCGLAQCGACKVILGGEAVTSCVLPLAAAEGQAVTTVEGLGSAADPHPVQRAFLAEQAAQCGYCTAGMIVAAKALLDRNPRPSDDDIRQALDGNLCRCGVYHRILKAVRRAAAEMAR